MSDRAPSRQKKDDQPRRSARGRARLRAVEILFESEQRGEPALEVMARRRTHDDKLIGAYTEEIIRGVLLRCPEIDEAVQTWSRGWTIERMPAVDRTVLRTGAWELLYNDDVPDAVAVSEAVGLARELSTDDSPGFVNGLLGRLQSVKPSLLAGQQPTEAQTESAAPGDALPLPDFSAPSFADAEVIAPSEDEEPGEQEQAEPEALEPSAQDADRPRRPFR